MAPGYREPHGAVARKGVVMTVTAGRSLCGFLEASAPRPGTLGSPGACRQDPDRRSRAEQTLCHPRCCTGGVGPAAVDRFGRYLWSPANHRAGMWGAGVIRLGRLLVHRCSSTVGAIRGPCAVRGPEPDRHRGLGNRDVPDRLRGRQRLAEHRARDRGRRIRDRPGGGGRYRQLHRLPAARSPPGALAGRKVMWLVRRRVGK